MTNKTELVKVLKENGATWNKDEKSYHMNELSFNKVMENIEGVVAIKSKTEKNMYGLKINNMVVTKVITDVVKVNETTKQKATVKKEVEETKKPVKKVSRETSGTKKVKKENVEVGKNGHKAKGSSYIILLKNKDDKKETKKTDLTTCAEVKAFLKTVSKKQLEYLRIYDENKNEVRKSAWVG